MEPLLVEAERDRLMTWQRLESRGLGLGNVVTKQVVIGLGNHGYG